MEHTIKYCCIPCYRLRPKQRWSDGILDKKIEKRKKEENRPRFVCNGPKADV